MSTNEMSDNMQNQQGYGYGQQAYGYGQQGYGQLPYGSVPADGSTKTKLTDKLKNNKKIVIIGGALLAALLVVLLLVKVLGSSSGGASSPETAAKKYIQVRFEEGSAKNLLSIMLPEKARSEYNKIIKKNRGATAEKYLYDELDMEDTYYLQYVKVKDSDKINNKDTLADVEEEIYDQFGVKLNVKEAYKVNVTFEKKSGEDGSWKEREGVFYCYKYDGKWFAVVRDIER